MIFNAKNGDYMKFFKEKNWLRDLFFALALIGLVRYVLKQQCYTPVPTHALLASMLQEQPFTVHEVDADVITRIEQLEEQLNNLKMELLRLQASSPDQEELEDISDEVEDIKYQYQTTSPALAFLGPLGTASIVLKEQKLEKRLLVQINRAIAYTNKRLEKMDNEATTTIEKGLEVLDQKINDLTHTNPYQ